EAVMYRQLAEKTENIFGKQELLDLAVVCEEVANSIEDRLTGGEPPEIFFVGIAPVAAVTLDRFIFEGGWVEREGGTCFNLYQPPLIEPGNAAEVGNPAR